MATWGDGGGGVGLIEKVTLDKTWKVRKKPDSQLQGEHTRCWEHLQ